MHSYLCVWTDAFAVKFYCDGIWSDPIGQQMQVDIRGGVISSVNRMVSLLDQSLVMR